MERAVVFFFLFFSSFSVYRVSRSVNKQFAAAQLFECLVALRSLQG